MKDFTELNKNQVELLLSTSEVIYDRCVGNLNEIRQRHDGGESVAEGVSNVALESFRQVRLYIARLEREISRRARTDE